MTPPASTSGLAPVRTLLPNRVVIIAKETRRTPAVTIHLSVRAGSVRDPLSKPGATNLLAHVIDRGTDRRSAEDIADVLESRGISLAIYGTRHVFSIICTCLAEDFDPILALIGEIVTSPSIPESELATRKGETVTSIRQDEDNPAVRAVEGLMALLYPDPHPYGRPTKGTVDVVERIGRDDLVALHRTGFVPSAASLAVVGDIEASHVLDAASRIFGDWRGPQPLPERLPSVVPATDRRRVVMPMMNKAQADVAYGFTTIARRDPSYFAFWLMDIVLGQYALGGRLGDSIRERQGMAYYVSSNLTANVAPGPLVIRAGVSPANVDRAIASVDHELDQIRREGLSSKEVDDARRYLIGSMPRALETNAGIANFLQDAEFFELGSDHDVRLPGLLGSVTLDDVNAAARRVLNPEHATVVIAGPYSG